MQAIPVTERIFDCIENVLYITIKGIIEAGLSENYYYKLRSQNNGRVKFLQHPENGKCLLVAYETISDQHKEKIKQRFRNPYDFVAKVPIINMLIANDDARRFFTDYRYNNKSLSLRRINQYTRACEWLDMLLIIDDKRNRPIKDMGLKVPEFFEHAKQIIDVEKANGMSDTYNGKHELPADFPATYQNLLRKRDEYKEKKYDVLLVKFERMTGNNIAAKVFDENCEDQLLSLIENPHQYDDITIALLYNSWAVQNNYPAIVAKTVGVWRRKKGFEVTSSREGNNAFNEKFIRQVKGMRPTAPLYLVEHDDNNLDFLYQGMDENGKLYQYAKYVSIVVTDSFNDYVLGKSYLPQQSPVVAMVYHAYMDAMYNIRRLTGQWYLPFEVKADRWQYEVLSKFYNKIALNAAPALGNKHRGYIEPFFGSPHWKRCQQLVSNGNWSGNNMTAKYRGLNPDMMEMSLKTKSRPTIGMEAEQQVENFFHLLRNAPDIKNGDLNAASKEQQWLTAFNALPDNKKRPITDEQFLMLFGVKHQPHGRTIRINNRGIEPQISGTQYSYDLPQAWMYNELVGEDVSVYYDPFDMSRVLVTNEKDIRFIAHTAQLIPRALKDHYTNSRTFLNAILEQKKQQVNKAAGASNERKQRTGLNYYNAEGMLQGAVMVKEQKNEAEQKFLEQSEQQQQQYYEDNYGDELNQFFKAE